MTAEDHKLLSRHFLKINIFGYVLTIWNTSPSKVLSHLKEIETNNPRLTAR